MKKFKWIMYLSMVGLPQLFVNYHKPINLKINNYNYPKQNNVFNKKNIQLNSTIQIIKNSKNINEVSNHNLNNNFINVFQISMLGFVLGSLLFGFITSVTIGVINKFWKICSPNKSMNFNSLQINSLNSTSSEITGDFNVTTYEHIHEDGENMSTIHSAIDTSTEIQVVNNDNSGKSEAKKTDVEVIHHISETSNWKTQHVITNSTTPTLESEHSSNYSETITYESNEHKNNQDTSTSTTPHSEDDNHKSQIERLTSRLLELNRHRRNTLQKLNDLELEKEKLMSKIIEISENINKLNKLRRECVDNDILFNNIIILRSLCNRYVFYKEIVVNGLSEELENSEIESVFNDIDDHTHSRNYFIEYFGPEYRRDFYHFLQDIQGLKNYREYINPINNELNRNIHSWVRSNDCCLEIKLNIETIIVEMYKFTKWKPCINSANVIFEYNGIYSNIKELLNKNWSKIYELYLDISKEVNKDKLILSEIELKISNLEEELRKI